MVLYMNKDGERKSAFVAAIEKEKDGAEGQVQCMEEAILSLITKRIRSTVTDVVDCGGIVTEKSNREC